MDSLKDDSGAVHADEPGKGADVTCSMSLESELLILRNHGFKISLFNSSRMCPLMLLARALSIWWYIVCASVGRDARHDCTIAACLN